MEDKEYKCRTVRRNAGRMAILVVISGEHDKPFRAKAITLIDNIQKALGNADN